LASDRLVYTAGQIGLDPATGMLVPGGIEAETAQVLANLGAVLEAAGASWRSVLKATVFLTDMGEFGLMNGVYGAVVHDPYPARSTIQVSALPLGARVEIELVAVADRRD
jgi:2-iminobutanoate/2-iminopropanoate deaminase